MEDNSKVFSVSPRSLGVKGAGGMPRHLDVSPMKTKSKEDTIYTLSMRSNSAESYEKKDVTASPTDLKSNVSPKVNQQTRNIAALAAAKKRRQQQQEMSSRLNLQDSQFNQTFISNEEGDNGLTSSRLASHNRNFDSRFNLNDDMDSYDNHSLNLDAMSYHGRADNTPTKGGQRVPKGTRYRHQALLRVQQNQNNGLPVSSSSSDRLLESSEMHSKVI